MLGQISGTIVVVLTLPGVNVGLNIRYRVVVLTLPGVNVGLNIRYRVVVLTLPGVNVGLNIRYNCCSSNFTRSKCWVKYQVQLL